MQSVSDPSYVLGDFVTCTGDQNNQSISQIMQEGWFGVELCSAKIAKDLPLFMSIK